MKLMKIFLVIKIALAIRDSSDMDWKTKYDNLSNIGLEVAIERAGYSLPDWFDSNATYEENVKAYCSVLENFKRRYSDKGKGTSIQQR